MKTQQLRRKLAARVNTNWISICSILADLLVEDEKKATAWDYAKGSQLRYCMLILQYYREKLDGTTLSMENGTSTSLTRQSTDITPRGRFLSPRPPEMPQSRSSTPNTPRSRYLSWQFTCVTRTVQKNPIVCRMMTTRASTKRSSMAASINGSISPPAEDLDRGMSTYRSSNTSLHGPVFPQKKAKPNSPRDEPNMLVEAAIHHFSPPVSTVAANPEQNHETSYMTSLSESRFLPNQIADEAGSQFGASSVTTRKSAAKNFFLYSKNVTIWFFRKHFGAEWGWQLGRWVGDRGCWVPAGLRQASAADFGDKLQPNH